MNTDFQFQDYGDIRRVSDHCVSVSPQSVPFMERPV
jgi:hypothetical protein